MQDSLHRLGVKKVKLAIDYDSEEKKIKRTVTITAEVSAEEAAQVDHLTKLNATFVIDLHVEGYQRELIPGDTIAPGKVAERQPKEKELDPGDQRPGSEIDKAAETAKEEAATKTIGAEGAVVTGSEDKPKRQPKREKVGVATKVGSGPPW